MNKVRSLLLILLLSGGLLKAYVLQDAVPVTWATLENIQFKEEYVADIQGYMLFPRFPAALKKLDGKIVTIKGYVVPFDRTGAKVALSANSYAACFFCGKAGPASVMTINLVKPNTKYRTDQYRTFTGRLRLNEKDFHEFYYVLEEATEAKK